MTTHHRCLFCGASTTTNSYCSSCRGMDRCAMFDALLKLFGNATNTNTYYHHIKNISQEIETVSTTAKQWKLYCLSLINSAWLASHTISIQSPYVFWSKCSQNWSTCEGISWKWSYGYSRYGTCWGSRRRQLSLPFDYMSKWNEKAIC